MLLNDFIGFAKRPIALSLPPKTWPHYSIFNRYQKQSRLFGTEIDDFGSICVEF